LNHSVVEAYSVIHRCTIRAET